MSLPIITLPGSDKALSSSDTLSLPAEGLPLTLRLGAHEELERAILILQGSSSEETLASSNSTEHGPVEDNQWPTENVNWLIADWGEPRSLVSVNVSAAAGKIRLKVFVNGGWVPLYPNDVIDMGSEQRFPAVVTSKLMLEPVGKVSEYGVFPPTATTITGLTLKCTKQPIDVSLSIDDMPAVFQQAGALPMGQGVPIDDFTAAVNANLADAGERTEVPLRVHAATVGEFYIKTFDTRIVSVATALEGVTAGDSISLPWGGEAQGRVRVGAKQKIREVRFRQRAELADERLYWPVVAPTSRQALLCDPEHRVAQAYAALPQGLVLQGIDLYLRAGNRAVEDGQADINGTLTLHPDNKGMPGEQPFPGAEIEFNLPLQKESLTETDWQGFEVSASELSNGPWWAVLSVDSGGELFWYTDVATSMSDYVVSVLYHVAGGGWLNASKADPAAIWALSRLRVNDRKSKTTQLALRRGGILLPISADDEGRVAVSDPEVLARLNKGNALNRSALDIVVSAEAPAQVAGQVKVSEIRIVSVDSA